MIKKLMTSVFILGFTSMAMAANIGDTAEELGKQVNSITDFVIIGATLMGIVFLVLGGINLKKHGDNPQQVPLVKPLIFLASGALLFGLGSTSSTMQETLFGKEARTGESKNGKFDDFG